MIKGQFGIAMLGNTFDAAVAFPDGRNLGYIGHMWSNEARSEAILEHSSRQSGDHSDKKAWWSGKLKDCNSSELRGYGRAFSKLEKVNLNQRLCGDSTLPLAYKLFQVPRVLSYYLMNVGISGLELAASLPAVALRADWFSSSDLDLTSAHWVVLAIF